MTNELLEDRTLLSAAVATDKPDYAPGQTALISGSGFVPGETVLLQVVDGVTGQAPPANTPWSVSAGADGSFTTTWTVTAPDSTGPQLTVTATGAQADVASAQFSDLVTPASPTVTTDLPNYQPGATAQIAGSGFLPNETVTLLVVNAATGQPAAGSNPWTVTTDGNGCFTTSWYVNPADEPDNSFVLSANGSAGDSASTTYSDGTVNVAYITGPDSLWNSQGGLAADQAAMNAAFGTNGWNEFTFSNAAASVFVPAAYKFLFFDGGDQCGNDIANFLSANKSSLQSFVSNGGSLFIDAAQNTGPSTIATGFGPTLEYGAYYSSFGYAVNSSNVIFNSPNSAGGEWSGNYFNGFTGG